MKKFELVKETLDNMSEHDLFWLYKEYVGQARLYDDKIFDMDDFNEIMSALTPMDVASKILYGDFRPNDCYFKFDGYANLESIGCLKNAIDLDEIADYIINNENSLENNEIQEILDKDDNEEENEKDEEEEEG